MSNSSKILLTTFITVVIDMLGIGIIIPIFPMLILPQSEFYILPLNYGINNAFIMSGWLLATYSIFQFIFSPILGQLSDKYGRKKILFSSILGTSISYLIFAYAIYAKSIPLMFISRAIDGLTGANISVAQAIIGDVSPDESRAKNYGLIGVAIGIGFVFGPFIGGVLSNPLINHNFNAITPFYFICGLSFINALLVFKFIPNTNREFNTTKISLNRSITNISQAFKSYKLGLIISVVFLFNAGFTFYTTFFGIILANQFNFNSLQIGSFFAYFGIMIILAQGMVVRRLAKKLSEVQVLRFAIIGAGFCLLLFYFVTRASWLYYIPPFLAVFMALSKAFSSSLISKVVSQDKLGEAMGINSSASALANLIPAIMSGYIASHHARLPILVGSIIMFIAGIIFRKLYK